jgi:AraC-like DNA-binding protein
MTTKDFQKSANKLQEISPPHSGIIDDHAFNEQFQLHCYKPSPNLEPFVVHIWVQRKRRPSLPGQKPPVEVLSGPNIYLFLGSEAAFIQGITRRKFKYNASMSEVTAGIKFRPGGFYAFAQKSVSAFSEQTLPATSVFPSANESFSRELLSQSDDIIVATLETLLQTSQPKTDKHLELITRIIAALDSDGSLKTVGSVARAFHMSERTLQLLFQTYVGVNVKWAITRKRFLEAIDRMKMQPHALQTDIATELGYNSQSHFTREFKEIIGRPPSAYLKGRQ